MKLFLTKADRIKYLGFDDRCVALLGIPLMAGVAFLLFSTGKEELAFSGLLLCFGVGMLHTIFYWVANRFWVINLRRRFPRQQDTWKRSVLMVSFAILSVFLLELASDFIIGKYFPFMFDLGWSSEPAIFSFMVAITLCLLVLAMYESAYFFTKYRQSTIERERLAKENMQSQLSVLKQQMNPHFLFNSLNTLVNLIPEDSGKATLFTQRLSAVYRRILEWRHKELITLEEEVLALQDYVFLMQTRFENKLEVCWLFGAGTRVQCEGEGPGIDLSPEVRNYRVVPLSIQLLVENAIKHNVVSSAHPLRIDITLAGNRITVSHPLRPRNDGRLNSTGWGHQNLKARYDMVTEEPVVITQTTETYKVSIPVFPVKSGVKYATA